MSKHTPGPWVSARDFDENGRRAKVTTIAVCCDFVIGLPAAYEGGNYRDGDPSGDPEADARLIAAAPDLLEALKALAGLYPSAEEMNDSDEYSVTEIDWVEIARAAIAKATGEQP